MRAFKFFLIGIIITFSSCTEEQVDIKKLYNSGESFKIEFSNWKSLDLSILKAPEERFPGVSFMYSKKNDYAHVVFDDANHGEYANVKYNKLHSDDSQTCLQNDDVRFVIVNNGTRYALKMYYWENLKWNELAYFDDGKSTSTDTVETRVSYGVPPLLILIVVVLVAVLIWGIKKRKKTAIITPVVILAAMVSAGLFTGTESTKSEKRAPIDSLISCSDCGYTDVYESPDGYSSVIGKIHNNDNKSYPMFSSNGPWYEIEFNGVTGYVYERDCILQSGMGDI